MGTLDAIRARLDAAQNSRNESDIGMGDPYWSILDEYRVAAGTPPIPDNSVPDEVINTQVIPSSGSPSADDGKIVVDGVPEGS